MALLTKNTTQQRKWAYDSKHGVCFMKKEHPCAKTYLEILWNMSPYCAVGMQKQQLLRNIIYVFFIIL